MDETELAIHHAWQRVLPALLDDPHELARRLARRRTPTLTRPPRAWCIAIRASDSRLPPSTIDDPSSTIDITAALLRRLCAPVQVFREFLDEAAGKLGTTKVGLTTARIKNILAARHIPLLGGRRGKPIPLLTSQRALDPNARLFAQPDPLWTWTAQHLTARIPRDLRATLTRVPHFLSHVSKHRYDEARHPELDSVSPARAKKRLPQPQPDVTAWYKWSRSGHFLGDDPTNWRKSFQDLGERPPRFNPRRGKAHRRPAPSTSSGSLHFNGYFWLCPLCNTRCRTIYYPLAPICLLRDVPRMAQVVDIPAPVTGFACARCHRIRFFSRLPAEAWNQLIAYLTAGLLYGREVQRPAWFTKDRKRPYKPHANPRPALRRQQVVAALLKGYTRARIVRDLKIALPALVQQINKIYRSERVRGQRALLLKYNLPLPPHLIQVRYRVLARLESGELPDEIAARLQVQVATVHRYIRDLRHEGKLPRLARRRKRESERCSAIDASPAFALTSKGTA